MRELDRRVRFTRRSFLRTTAAAARRQHWRRPG